MSNHIYSCCTQAEAGALRAQAGFAALGEATSFHPTLPEQVTAAGSILVFCETHYSAKDAGRYAGATVLATESRPLPQKSAADADPMTIQPVRYEEWVSDALLVTETGAAFDPQAYINQILRGQE